MKLRNPRLIRVIARLAALVVRAWLRTVRESAVALDGRVHPTDPRRERFIYAFWHETLLAPTKMQANVKILVSQSADGELITQVCQHLGFGVVRGSASRGGAAGLLSLLRADRDAHLVLTPDGPRGPRRRLKPGIIFLASEAGLPIVPVGVAFDNAWRAKSWDRFAIPRPFSKAIGVIGEPISIPSQLDSQSLEHYRAMVEAAMLKVTSAAEQAAETSRLRAPHKAPSTMAAGRVIEALPPTTYNAQVSTAAGAAPALKKENASDGTHGIGRDTARAA